MPLGELEAKPGNTPGGNVGSTSEILGSVCPGIVESLSRSEVAATSEYSDTALGSWADVGASTPKLDISVSCDRFLR